jgi:ABC-type dipeptide/oligopeptide/nickel transport system permease component
MASRPTLRIAAAIPVTIRLILLSFILVAGIGFGIVSALKPNTAAALTHDGCS